MRSHNDMLVSICVEWTSELSNTWTEADGTHNEVVIEEPEGAGPETDMVHVYIPQPPTGKLFARLKVLVFEE